MSVRLLIGDCRERLRELPAKSVNCCVTSPPYFGLRDYGVDGQIGLEDTPDAFVAQMVEVFREVRRVLRDDGTLWLNLGDSYASAPGQATRGGPPSQSSTLEGNGHRGGGPKLSALKRVGESGNKGHPASDLARRPYDPNLKPKDLIGIPWAVAQALRDPYYTGEIKRERDRAWLAAMIDGEGTICGFHHVRADDGRPRTGVHVTITNSSAALLDEAHRIWPASRSEHERPGAGHYGSRQTWRWICHGTENKTLLLRELYPHLIAKKRQAMVAYNLLLLMADAKRLGHSPQRDSVREKRKLLTDLLSALNQGAEPILPSWLVEPPSVFEPGWYLRQDIIWAKPNPMPESVRDRCTKAHEYVFLLSKGPRYYFDVEAIAEAAACPEGPGTLESHKYGDAYASGASEHRTAAGLAKIGARETRNKRSVWTVGSQPFKEAHFATYPPELIEPCILAGCPVLCCGKCGAPVARLTERVDSGFDGSKYGERAVGASGGAITGGTAKSTLGSSNGRATGKRETTGFAPTCGCDADMTPGTVLDPFGGAGTTGLVADRLQRSAILIELNPAYAEIARKRLEGDAGMFSEIEAA